MQSRISPPVSRQVTRQLEVIEARLETALGRGEDNGLKAEEGRSTKQGKGREEQRARKQGERGKQGGEEGRGKGKSISDLES